MTSRRIEFSGRSAPRQIVFAERPVPSPGPGDVRVRVRYAGVAHGDLMRREGVLAPPFAFTPGYDVTGDVDLVGARVSTLARGQRVAVLMPLTGFGGYAEHVVVPAKACVSIPDAVHARDALGLGLNAITAYQTLTRVAKLSAGNTVLVHGAAGGVGCAVLDVGRYLGLQVFGTASAGKHHVVLERGGSPIDYRSDDFVAVIRERTNGRGVDAVLDGIGGEHLLQSAKVLAPGGTLVALGISGDMGGGLAGIRGAMGYALRAALKPRLRMRPYAISASPGCGPAACRSDWRQLMEALAQGRLRAPLIGAERALARAEQALTLLSEGAVIGKVVLRT